MEQLKRKLNGYWPIIRNIITAILIAIIFGLFAWGREVSFGTEQSRKNCLRISAIEQRQDKIEKLTKDTNIKMDRVYRLQKALARKTGAIVNAEDMLE